MSRLVSYTPGPWTVDEYRNVLGQYPDRDEDTIICEVFDICEGLEGDSPDADANARLIAAAPALLEACEALAEAANLPIHSDWRNRDIGLATQKARAAIALATGAVERGKA